jgi:hypothetical protein
VISLLHPGPGPGCPLTRMLGLELMSKLAFHPAHGQTPPTVSLSVFIILSKHLELDPFQVVATGITSWLPYLAVRF